MVVMSIHLCINLYQHTPKYPIKIHTNAVHSLDICLAILYYYPMKYVNVRQLLSNIGESTENLPVTVTRYGVPIFKIISVETEEEEKISNKKSENPTCEFPFCFAEAKKEVKGQWLCGEHLK